MNWLRIRELVRKEFIQLFRDKKNRPILIMAPLIQLLVFGYVVNYDIKDIRVALMDQARTSESRMLIDAFRANKIFRMTHFSEDAGEPDKLLLAGKVDLVVKIPPDFSEKIRKGETADVQILADGSMSNMASVRIAYTLSVLDRLNRQLLRELYPQRLDYGKIDARIRTWYNPNLDSQNFFVPGIVAFLIMLISLLFTSMAIIKEKEAGTMEQLIVTPLKPIELIVGKTIPYIIISLAQMMAVVAFCHFLVRVAAGRQRRPAVAGHLSVSVEHAGGRSVHLHDLHDAAAGHDDDFFLHPALFHAQRLRFSHRQHAGIRSMVDLFESFEVFSGHHPGHFSQGRGSARALAAVRFDDDSGLDRICRGHRAVPEAVGLRVCCRPYEEKSDAENHPGRSSHPQISAAVHSKLQTLRGRKNPRPSGTPGGEHRSESALVRPSGDLAVLRQNRGRTPLERLRDRQAEKERPYLHHLRNQFSCRRDRPAHRRRPGQRPERPDFRGPPGQNRGRQERGRQVPLRRSLPGRLGNHGRRGRGDHGSPDRRAELPAAGPPDRPVHSQN